MLTKTKKVLFYAPLKSPDHETPSGDRKIARLLIEVLEATGFNVDIASKFRSWSSGKELEEISRKEKEGRIECQRLIAYAREHPEFIPDFWFTYHLYHKAPDYLGPTFCEAFDVPYIVAEASYAHKRDEGIWGHQNQVVKRSLRLAHTVFSFGKHDMAGILPFLKPSAEHHYIAPFLDRREVSTKSIKHIGKTPRLITVAMMRRGDKFDSYRLLAEILKQSSDQDWQLTIVGDGECFTEVQALFSQKQFPGREIIFLGQKSESELYEIYQNHDVFIWPAINEAFGMALLEAQFAGLPVIAGDYGSVSSIVQHGETGFVVPDNDVAVFQKKLFSLLSNKTLVEKMGSAARIKSEQMHSFDGVCNQFAKILYDLVA